MLSIPFSCISFSNDKENLFNNQSFLGWWSFPLFLRPLRLIQQYYYVEKLDAGQSESSTENLYTNVWVEMVNPIMLDS